VSAFCGNSRHPTAVVVRDASAGSGQAGHYRFDEAKCIKWDACREQAPYAIAVLDEYGP